MPSDAVPQIAELPAIPDFPPMSAGVASGEAEADGQGVQFFYPARVYGSSGAVEVLTAPPVQAVSEPQAWALLIAGLAALIFWRKSAQHKEE